MSGLPFSPAAERNRQPIFDALIDVLGRGPRRVLEVGSGTGQHAEFIAAHWPSVHWQPSDRADYLPGLHARLAAANLNNVAMPLLLDVDEDTAVPDCNVVYTANTLHIMSWPSVQRFFAQAGRWLAPGGWLIAYGPFNVGGRATSRSNADFDRSLRARDSAMGVRGREDVCILADRCGFSLMHARALPANNQLLAFARRAS